MCILGIKGYNKTSESFLLQFTSTVTGAKKISRYMGALLQAIHQGFTLDH